MVPQIEEELTDLTVVIDELDNAMPDLEVTDRSNIAEPARINFYLHPKVVDLCHCQVD